VGIPQPLGAITTALMRPGTYIGSAREFVGTAQCALRYPLGVLDATIPGPRPSSDEAHATPVVLVHGLAHNRSGWNHLSRRLTAAGFTNIHTVNYNAFRHDVPSLAAMVGARVELARSLAGTDKVHVIGHSMGGILLRWYVQELGGHDVVDTAITVVSPHRGTLLAVSGDRTLRQLRPGSPILRQLRDSARPSDVRWIAYYSNIDWLVQPVHSAMIKDRALRATNILIKDYGHVSAILSPQLGRSIVQQLEQPRPHSVSSEATSDRSVSAATLASTSIPCAPTR
jgi:pimeloyl-ACP methyl ester carboxylesterase